MGGAAETAINPIFKLKAVGAFKQKPGCPDYSSTNITNEEIERIRVQERNRWTDEL